MSVDELKQRVMDKRVVFVVGEAVSLIATQGDPVASWQGLLRNGVERAANLLHWDDEERTRRLKDVDDGLPVAELVRRDLETARRGESEAWLSETIGRLTPREPGILKAIRAFQLPLLTTNYDDLLERGTQLRPLSWNDRRRVLAFASAVRPDGVLHLYGVWRDEASLVLDVADQDRIQNDGLAGSVLRRLALTHSFVFVGFDEMREYDRVGRFMQWMAGIAGPTSHSHYSLAVERNVALLQRRYSGGPIRVVGYGASSAKLLPFLRALRRTPGATRATPAPVRQPGARARFHVANFLSDVRQDERDVVLLRTDWDDNGFLCMFRVVVFDEQEAALVLGECKIVNPRAATPGPTVLPETFDILPEGFVSLGQSSNYYDGLKAVPLSRRREILQGLRDALLSPEEGQTEWPVWDETLVRFAEARQVFERRAAILSELGLTEEVSPDAPTGKRIDVKVMAALKGFEKSHVVELSLSSAPQDLGLRRIAVIVGRNGAGKTQFLAALAAALSGLERDKATLVPEWNAFTIALSYSAFDRFSRPRRSEKVGSYVYSGLRLPTDDPGNRILLDVELAIERTANNIQELRKTPERATPGARQWAHLACSSWCWSCSTLARPGQRFCAGLAQDISSQS